MASVTIFRGKPFSGIMGWTRQRSIAGSECVSGSTSVTGKRFIGFVVNAASTVETMTISSVNGQVADDTDAVNTMGLSGVSLSGGCNIIVPKGFYISQIKFTAGSASVHAYK